MQKDANNRPNGTCFINFKKPDHARIAIENMNGFELAGMTLKVRIPPSISLRAGSRIIMWPISLALSPSRRHALSPCIVADIVAVALQIGTVSGRAPEMRC